MELCKGAGPCAGRDEFPSNFSLQSSTASTFADCFSGIPGGAPVVVFSSAATASFRNYSGGIAVGGLTAGNIAAFDLDPGALTLDSSCLGGDVLVRGVGLLTDNSQGTPVISEGLLQPSSLDTILTGVLSARDNARAANLQTQTP